MRLSVLFLVVFATGQGQSVSRHPAAGASLLLFHIYPRPSSVLHPAARVIFLTCQSHHVILPLKSAGAFPLY